MRARPVGEHAVLVECADTAGVAATYAALVQRAADLGSPGGVLEVVPAARTVLVDGVAHAAETARLLSGWPDPAPAAAAEPVPAAEVVLPAVYDGADLDDVARQWDVTTAEVVRIHTTTTFRVAFCGFAPGFAYCTGLPDGLRVSRRAEPRAAVPPGAVAMAGEYTAAYPTASPGGWQLIGRTRAVLWRPDRDPPALLTPGTAVRFTDD
jgi:KipI family sensor histidine kinase inhibitor